MRQGFTLIELLLVVSIIGILIGITMRYLGGARAKGNDASVQSNLGTIRALSEIYYLDNFNSYLPVGERPLALLLVLFMILQALICFLKINLFLWL